LAGTSSKSSNEPSEAPRERSSGVRISAVIVIALAVAVVAWLLLRGDDEDSSKGTAPEIVSVDDLKDIAASKGQTIYWAGEQPGAQLEYTETEDGKIYVRYLTPGIEVGARTPTLTVGTYPAPNGLGALKAQADTPGAVTKDISGGGFVYSSKPKALNAYVAFPGVPLQIEVFDPRAGHALTVAESGSVVPIE